MSGGGPRPRASAGGDRLELRVDVRPAWPFRLGGGSADGLMRRRGASLQRLLHVGGEPVHVAIVQPAADRVVFGARAASREAADQGIARMRFATGVDDDLRPFYDRFHGDPVIGRAVRAHPRLRVRRRPHAWEALLAAVTEQLIEFERAIAIQRRMIAALGSRCPRSDLRDGPGPGVVSALAPARLASFDLAPKRAIALRRVAREVACGRVELEGGDPDAADRRLLAVPEIGAWTVEMLALHGRGRYDRVAAGDLGFLELVGRLLAHDPRARADVAEVRGFFEPYGEWRGLAGEYLRWGAARGLLIRPARRLPGPAPRPAGTRWSAPEPRPAVA